MERGLGGRAEARSSRRRLPLLNLAQYSDRLGDLPYSGWLRSCVIANVPGSFGRSLRVIAADVDRPAGAAYRGWTGGRAYCGKVSPSSRAWSPFTPTLGRSGGHLEEVRRRQDSSIQCVTSTDRARSVPATERRVLRGSVVSQVRGTMPTQADPARCERSKTIPTLDSPLIAHFYRFLRGPASCETKPWWSRMALIYVSFGWFRLRVAGRGQL